jgi:Domain of unknown function (DUF5666)
MTTLPPAAGFRRRELMLAALALLGGCGGGVESGGTGTGAAPPTLAYGPITGFGSIIVGGVRYDESNAAIEADDGTMLSRTALRLGMQAEVMASQIAPSTTGAPSAVASSVRLRSEIVGPVEAIDTAAGELTVLGQRVAIVASTAFDDALAGGLAALSVGDAVEVYADLDRSSNRYVATRVERRAAGGAFKLRGAVGSLSVAARTLTIGAAVIDWSGVAPADPAVALAPGAALRLTLSNAPAAGRVWRATALNGNVALLPDRERVEIEGRVSAFTSVARFEVNGFSVDAGAATFPNGNTGLVLGAKVEVKGSARGGVLLAASVEVKGEGDAGEVELHGSIESVDAPAQQFVVRGVRVVWSAATRFDSSTAADIRVGRQVEVKGVLSADGTRVEASEIHVER